MKQGKPTNEKQPALAKKNVGIAASGASAIDEDALFERVQLLKIQGKAGVGNHTPARCHAVVLPLSKITGAILFLCVNPGFRLAPKAVNAACPAALFPA
jgi:hypothetical protein